ncbi:MAG: carboxypeptidase Taq, partial [Lentimonas sp.]
SEALFLAINGVQRNPIRFESDEVTYNLHIILRFEIEKQLFDQTLAVKDLPEAWNTLSQEIIGLTPKNDREGVLQDIHWCDGSFGYFPSYCLGNMLAAQIWYTVRDALPGLESELEQGNFKPLLDWLHEHIYQHGKRYNTLELTERVTGKALRPEALIRYLQDRYLPLYT